MTAAEFKPHGALTLSNHGGIEVMLNDSGDGVFFRFNYGQDELDNEPIHEAEIEYLSTEDAEEDSDDQYVAAFRHGESTYYLSNFIRINR